MGAPRWSLVASLAVGLVLVASRPALAQPDTERAKKAFENAEKAMEKGDYEIAAREFGVAYEIMKDPVLFFWIGSAYEKGNDCKTAVVYFKRYLKEGSPTEDTRKTTEDSIKRCEAAAGTGAGAGAGDGAGTGDGAGAGAGTGGTGGTSGAGDTGAGAGAGGGTPDFGDAGGDGPVERPPSFVDVKPGWKRTAAWISIGATVAFATTGAVLGLSASSRQEDIENLIRFTDVNGNPEAFDGTIRERYDDLVSEGQDLDRYSKIAFGLAGAAAISAAVFFVLDAKSTGRREVRSTYLLTPVVTPGGVAVTTGWEF